MFERESEALTILSEPKVIKVPQPIFTGEEKGTSIIVMSFIEKGVPDESFWIEFGQQLATLHKTSNDQFGFEKDNYIGSLFQSNTFHDNWSSFFIEERLEVLVKKAHDSDALDADLLRRFDKLFILLEDFFPIEEPSLIHGDLWSGNYMANENGKPVIFDPAVYYGHREMDIAMSKLFGGFSPDFYEAYNDIYPMETGWQERVDVANLYPLLVHVLLFGGSYALDVKRILQRMS